MSMITKPIILDETGRQIASILEGIRDAISTKSVDVPNMPGVKFIDYDGTVVYFAGREEVLHMKKLPDAPVHVDLTAQGWNWSLADIKTYMTKYPDAVMTVGQMYIPSDGKTHMLLDVGPRLTIPLMIQQTVSEGVIINWGDGSEEETIEGTGVVTTSHTYEAEGEYEITLEVADGCTLDFGDVINNVFGEKDTQIYITSLKHLFVGIGVTNIGNMAFNGCHGLKTLILPNSIISIGVQSFATCYNITSLILPDSITNIGQFAFYDCYSITKLGMTNNITTIDMGAFADCYSLTNITLSNKLTNVEQRIFYSCYSVNNLIIPDSVTSIGQNAFTGCLPLITLIIPDSVTSIGQSGFSSCYKMFTLIVLAETPPTLANVKAFSKMPADCTIYVPHGKGDTYKEASGWSTWASQIQELPE